MIDVLVTGANGQLGKCLRQTQPTGLQARFFSRADLDVSDAHAVRRTVEALEPTFVINCAAYTNVDGAESDENAAHAINTLGVENLANVGKRLGTKLVHVSTDFVFDGLASTPYLPGSTTNPLGIYGKTKLGGESALRFVLPDDSLVIRTSWLYSEFGANFVKTMLRLFETKDSFQVVEDQRGSPTYAGGLAELIWLIASNDRFVPGVIHWCDTGVTSWYEFADAIGVMGMEMNLISKRASLSPILAADYGSLAPRPAYSALDCASTLRMYPEAEQRKWQDNLARMLSNLKRI